jgi:protocatechuate 3,4-dioxygenase beta subunit
MRLARRELLSKCMALGVLTSTANLLPSALAAAWQEKEKSRLAPTPAAELGPFYKRLAPSNSAMRAPGDPGMPLVVTGQVFSSRGELIPLAIVEIWQTNHEGLYDLDGYHYRTKLTTPADGKYEFSSVMPGHYPARVCQHIHYAVTAPGYRPLVTQLYFATDPVFEGDPDKNFVRDPLITSRELVRPVTLVGDPKDIHAAVKFELVLEAM